MLFVWDFGLLYFVKVGVIVQLVLDIYNIWILIKRLNNDKNKIILVILNFFKNVGLYFDFD